MHICCCERSLGGLSWDNAAGRGTAQAAASESACKRQNANCHFGEIAAIHRDNVVTVCGLGVGSVLARGDVRIG